MEGAALFSRLWASRSYLETLAAGGPAEAPPPAELIGASARSLGVAIVRPGSGQINRILIPKNSPLPASATLHCRPSREDVRNHGVLITEGDEEDLGECSVVGPCVLSNLPAGVTTGARISITLRLDESNLLEAVVQHHDTRASGQRRSWS